MKLITIGKIVNTHGLNGALKVKSFTDFKEQRYNKGTPLYIAFEREFIPVTVVKYHTVKLLDIVTFKEFTHINEVEKYKGSDLVIDEELIHELPVDEFYFTEIIGMEVYSEDLLIGKCSDIRDYPQGEVLVVQTNKRDILIPFRKEFIKEVNKKENKLHLIMWEGLL
ncbi:MAG: 16S rRNA processing protein RimM [Candidatus Izimaplasma sp.]|nr:16S rRNA processing protein RimM [Candidatus Izimaplasma bacterium]